MGVELLLGFLNQFVHPVTGVVDALRLSQQSDRLANDCLILASHPEYAEQPRLRLLASVGEVVQDHESKLPLVDVLATVAFLALHLLALQIEDVVLDLEGHTEVLDEAAEHILLGTRGADVGADHPRGESRQDCRFLSCHLQVLRFCGVVVF